LCDAAEHKVLVQERQKVLFTTRQSALQENVMPILLFGRGDRCDNVRICPLSPYFMVADGSDHFPYLVPVFIHHLSPKRTLFTPRGRRVPRLGYVLPINRMFQITPMVVNSYPCPSSNPGTPYYFLLKSSMVSPGLEVRLFRTAEVFRTSKRYSVSGNGNKVIFVSTIQRNVYSKATSNPRYIQSSPDKVSFS